MAPFSCRTKSYAEALQEKLKSSPVLNASMKYNRLYTSRPFKVWWLHQNFLVQVLNSAHEHHSNGSECPSGRDLAVLQFPSKRNKFA